MTLHKQNAAVAEVLEDLSKTLHIKFAVEDTETAQTHVCVFTDNTTLRDVLDGIVHLHDWQWVRRQDKTLELRPSPHPYQWDILLPHTEAQAEQFRQGRQFLSELPNCTPAMWAALTDGNQNGVSFNSLPAEMQKTVASMLTAGTIDLAANGRPAAPSLEDSAIRLQQGPHQDWGKSYYVDVFDGHRGVGLSFRVFNDPNQNADEIVPIAQALNAPIWHGAAQDAASRQEIAQDDARLKRLQVPVTVDLHDVPLYACLRTLAASTGISFAADTNKTLTPKLEWVTVNKSVAANGKSLMGVLDQLAALYGQTWGQTKSGMILFHPAPEKPPASG